LKKLGHDKKEDNHAHRYIQREYTVLV